MILNEMFRQMKRFLASKNLIRKGTAPGFVSLGSGLYHLS